MAKKFLEKEIAIMEGTITLLRSGINPYQLKVSDIADAAGIGKGTVYQYFTTKEEVIGQSIRYNLQKGMESMVREMIATSGFENRLNLVLDQIQRSVMDPLSPFHLIASAKDYGGFMEACEAKDGNMAQDMERFHGIMDLVLAEGLSDGMITESDSLFYRRMVLKSALFAWGHCLVMMNVQSDVDLEEARSQIHQMVKRAYR